MSNAPAAQQSNTAKPTVENSTKNNF